MLRMEPHYWRRNSLTLFPVWCGAQSACGSAGRGRSVRLHVSPPSLVSFAGSFSLLAELFKAKLFGYRCIWFLAITSLRDSLLMLRRAGYGKLFFIFCISYAEHR